MVGGEGKPRDTEDVAVLGGGEPPLTEHAVGVTWVGGGCRVCCYSLVALTVDSEGLLES